MELRQLPHLTPKRNAALAKAGIHQIRDLLLWIPQRYEAPAVHAQLADIPLNVPKVSVPARVTQIREEGFGAKKRLVVVFTDGTATLTGTWFKGISWVRKLFIEGEWYILTGKPQRFRGGIQMIHPAATPLKTEKTAVTEQGITPVYTLTTEMKQARITHHLLQFWIRLVLDSQSQPEFLPLYIRTALQLPERDEAFRLLHLPETDGDWLPALERFRFEEFFLFQMAMIQLHGKRQRIRHETSIETAGPLTRAFLQNLPFELTQGQRSALRQILDDLRSGFVMSRLVQGDVGAGKTVVAAAAMLMMIDAGYQAAIMAPTEILAEQHYRTLTNWLLPLEIDVRLLTGNRNTRQRREIITSLQSGITKVLIGTHALIEPEVTFARLGMVVIDEQHRFGVEQRAKLLGKGRDPHLLVMSATPIPRSLALTLYGDLDVSVIKGLPPGRKPIRTAIRTERNREDVYAFMAEVIREQGQIYVVYPLVEESEALDLKDATAGYNQLKALFPQARIGLLHGRMKADEKDAVMQLFKDGEMDILVSTTVIEVGVDVPNASVMVIEHAERFGLSQLHQLRGRIGRGERRSFCILMTAHAQSREARERLATMERTSDGFEIAEADLKLRGPGDFLGTRQSGLPEFRFADLARDQDILESAKKYAETIMQTDPEFSHESHIILKAAFLPYLEEKRNFFQKK